MGIGVKVRVWGKYALFSRPDILETNIRQK